MKSTTKSTTWNPGPPARGKLPDEALLECVVEWGESRLGGSPPPPSVSSTSSTPSSWPRSRFSACSTTATPPISAGSGSCTSGSLSRRPWCGTGSSPTWMMKRYVASRLCGKGLRIYLWSCWAWERGEYWCVPPPPSLRGTHLTVLGVTRQSPPTTPAQPRQRLVWLETLTKIQFCLLWIVRGLRLWGTFCLKGDFSVFLQVSRFFVRVYSHGPQLSQVMTGGLSGVFLFNNFIRFCYSGVERELC